MNPQPTKATLDWFSDRWLRAEKVIFTKLIRGSPADRVAWTLLQWWPDPEGDDDDPIADPTHQANLRAATDHIRLRLSELEPGKQAAVAGAMRRIGYAEPNAGGLFVEEMHPEEKRRRTDQLLCVFGLAEPAQTPVSQALEMAEGRGAAQ